MSVPATGAVLDGGLSWSATEPAQRLLAIVAAHTASQHDFFGELSRRQLSVQQIAGLLKNYDAHASVLRRLLLKAATIMPEAAVGFVLENVRNEYGNGDYRNNHQDQLKSVAKLAGVNDELWNRTKVEAGIKRFIPEACKAYFPASQRGLLRAAIAAGAITATELLAIAEFRAMKTAFDRLGLGTHVWFDHVTIEQEHSSESLELALYFCDNPMGIAGVERGMRALLDANLDLYDGLLSSIAIN